ncbi:MAG: hypothetical protein CMP24_03960 [Rickettsiales bacterium]|nr:hypothetical protein [Rickettsiales bacterium]
MWILLAVVFKITSHDLLMPVYDKALVHKTKEQCELSMQEIYTEYKGLQVNYPIEIRYEKNDNKQKFLIYSYKPDYTKPSITTYYHCLKIYSKKIN